MGCPTQAPREAKISTGPIALVWVVWGFEKIYFVAPGRGGFTSDWSASAGKGDPVTSPTQALAGFFRVSDHRGACMGHPKTFFDASSVLLVRAYPGHPPSDLSHFGA
jgi:hypothetical protein